MTMTPVVFYVMARDCGHRTWYSYRSNTGGLDWCESCRRYVGVIVTRKP